ncbi:MAG: ParB/RepB/Spo0J family partition protein [Pseudomonadota bacterium]
MKQRGLGRGLSALIPTDTAPDSDFFLCQIEEIRPNPYQMRRTPNAESLAPLAASIREKGILEPVVVRKRPGGESGYELIAGERRWRAAAMAGLKAVPALLREADEGESLELALIENIQREDLNPLEEAMAYRRLADEFSLPQAEIARRTGKDRSTVANSMRLLKLPQPIQQALLDGKLSAGHARAILALPGGEQLAAGDAILSRGLTVRQAEELRHSRPRNTFSRPPEDDPDLTAACHELMRFFGTRVRVTSRGKGGRIEIDYYSVDDFERILEKVRDRTEPQTLGA